MVVEWVRQRDVAPSAQIGGYDKLVPNLAFGEKLLPPMAGLSLIGLEVERQSTKAQTSGCATDRTRQILLAPTHRRR